MVYLSVKHSVADFAAWKTAFDEHEEMRKEAGSLGGWVLRNSGSPNDLQVMLKWDSAENANAFMSSPDLKAAMEKAGVTSMPEVTMYDTADESAA